MIRYAIALVRGAACATATAWWIGGGRVARLLGPPAPARRRAPPPLASRAARATLRLLARLPRSPWRNTCLYRSVAECLALRRYGVPARLRIGVAAGAPGTVVDVAAHAWVEVDGVALDPAAVGHVVLAPAAGPGTACP